jgi:hypothetical protein
MSGDADYFIGLDLGQAGAFTALAVLERTLRDDPGTGGRWAWRYAVRHLERFQMGTPYGAVLAWLASRTEKPPLQGATLVLDQTGVGRPVANSFRKAGLPVNVGAAVLTAGHTHAWHDGAHYIPKVELAGVLQLALQERRLAIAPQLEHAPTLCRELEAFRPRVRTVTDETVADWREREHDDLVFATALPLWLAERTSPADLEAMPLVLEPRLPWRADGPGWRRVW